MYNIAAILACQVSSADLQSTQYQLQTCALPIYVVIIGSDFHEQTLIDKKVDLIFCNPPYSEFELWTKQIIDWKSCNSHKLFEGSNPLLSAMKAKLFEAMSQL